MHNQLPRLGCRGGYVADRHFTQGAQLKPKPKFTVATLLLFTALVAGGISHVKTSRELSHVRSELTTLRNDLAVLDVNDESQIHAIALPTYGPMQWRWRIQLPDEGLMLS